MTDDEIMERAFFHLGNTARDSKQDVLDFARDIYRSKIDEVIDRINAHVDEPQVMIVHGISDSARTVALKEAVAIAEILKK